MEYKNKEELLKELKWVKFPVLDDGFVCLVDVMGSDHDIAEAARVSYGEGTSKTSNDPHLIRYLLRHKHMSPFEMAELKIMVRVPMDVWRQWIRHRTASVNEYSTRYSIAIDSAHKTTAWRKQSTNNRQGSCGHVDGDVAVGLTESENQLHDFCRRVYEDRISKGVAKEQARKDLPLSTYTEAYWKIDIRNLMNFFALRLDSHAQEEIRNYTEVIYKEIFTPLFPETKEAFELYNLNSLTLSQNEIVALNYLIFQERDRLDNIYYDEFENIIKFCKDDRIKYLIGEQSCREREECYEKFEKLGIVLPKSIKREEVENIICDNKEEGFFTSLYKKYIGKSCQ